MSEENEKINELVLAKRKEGQVVFATFEGLMSADLEEFIKQPAEGILYDLNRDGATVLMFIDDPKWVNDFAVGLVITRLKEKLEAVEQIRAAAAACAACNGTEFYQGRDGEVCSNCRTPRHCH